MATTIKLKNSVTATNAPSSLVQGEVAINVTDKKVWVGNAATTPIQLLGGGADGSFTNISVSSVATFGAGAVGTPSITTTGDTNTGIFFPAADTIAFTEGGVESMRIDSSGQVGIGTTSPSYPLDVLSNSSAVGVSIRGRSSDNVSLYNFTSNNGGTQYGFILGSPTELRLTQNGANVITAYTNGGERLRIDSSGNVGIGTSSPATKLHVAGGDLRLNDNFAIGWGGTGAAIIGANNSLLRFDVNGSERMRITSAGDVGIGITPDTKFEVSGTGAVMRISTNHSTSGTLDLSADATAAQIKVSWYNSAVPLVFKSGNTEQMRIDSSGNLLIACTTTNESLSVGVRLLASGSIKSTKSESNNQASTLDVYSTGASAYRFYVDMAGTVFATNTTISGISDQRLKENITDIDVGLDKVMALKPRKFDWKAGKGKDKKGDRGWIAQEFETVFPEMIQTWKDPAPEGEEPYKAVNADLIPVLVKAIQEQQALIENLTTRLNALEGN